MENTSASLQFSANSLNYWSLKRIPVNIVDTNSLRGGRSNALSLGGYINRDIQKMGIWRGETFKNYIQEEFYCFAEGMSTAMKQDFKFVKIAAEAYRK